MHSGGEKKNIIPPGNRTPIRVLGPKLLAKNITISSEILSMKMLNALCFRLPVGH
jgi:hypothetical protein